ncbi:MAG: LLM class flavin-dependent oxidoreductase [Chloroflexi bacterium]|nr:LLM class flavin-dependent oxidoreductase [Chloroflexota bacterium]
MRLGISWVVDDLRAFPDLVRATEAAGFHLLGVPDSQASVYRELYVSLTTAALASQRLRLAPWVTNPVTRHPAVTAAALASLHELAPGRIAGAIGTGDSGVINLGLRPARLATLQEYLRAVQTLLRGTPAEWRGRTAKLLWPRGDVPLLLSAEGPRTLELAGAEADGVVAGLGVTPEAVTATESALTRGAAQSGRDASALERWWFLRGSVADTYEEAEALALVSLVSMPNHAFRYSFEGKGVPERWQEPVRQLQARYDFTAHNQFGPKSPNGLLARELGLVEFLVERWGLVGTPRQVVERLCELESRGLTNVVLRIQTPDRLHFLQTWREEIGPNLASSD